MVSQTADLAIASVHAGIRDYYSRKVRRYGTTPLGVDWPCAPTQQLRFIQLMKLCDGYDGFSLDDLGCGYGALLEYLLERHSDVEINYLGIDLSPAMVGRATRLWADRPNARFVIGHKSPRTADFCVASGIFNVKEDQPVELWERFITETLALMAASTRLGFAFNLKFPLPFVDKRTRQLYLSLPRPWIKYCKRRLGHRVTLIQDYGLGEYTVLARR
jgi:SAM-dependent methyltransferase